MQIWRLITCFIFLGKPSFPFLLRVLWMCALTPTCFHNISLCLRLPAELLHFTVPGI